MRRRPITFEGAAAASTEPSPPKPRRAFCYPETQLTTSPAKFPKVYVLWAEGTDRFKIGYTADPIKKRCSAIDYMSPIPLRVVAVTPGDRARERALHFALREYRTHGEWFRLTEDAAWWLFAECGVDVATVRSAEPTDEDRLLLAQYRGQHAS